MASQVISDIGEKQLVREIISLISDSPNLHQGIGHDSAFLNIKVADATLVNISCTNKSMKSWFACTLSLQSNVEAAAI